MIRMIQSSSAAHAKAYFSDALLKSDYYLNDQELQGRYSGKLAARIGLSETATKENFFALCENRNPETGETLTPRNRDDRTTGYDINFHCPKSVSIVHALSKDNHIMDAFQQSVKDTMKDIESDSMTRVRKKGAYEDRNTGELLWADFTHQTARPVDGSAPDPHLHSHCFVFNATWDDQEQQIKAGQFRNIKRDMPYYQARFHKNLSDKLFDLGYQIKRTDKSFEIEGVPQGAIDLFSKRTNEIGEFAKEKGITDQKELSELGARTRSKKQKGFSMDELKTEWRKQVKENVHYQEEEETGTIRYAPTKEPSKVIAEDCVNFAVTHSFERASVIPDRRILATAYRHSIGRRSIDLDEISNKFKEDKQIIHVKVKHRTYCTTRNVLKEEKRMVDMAMAGQGKFKPLYKEAPAIKLKDQQANAISHILTTTHQVSIIRGAAGSGKTTLMQEAVELIEKTGKNVTVVAPTAQASRGVLVQEGFEDAETVAKLLQDEKLQNNLRNQVLWVDEAGLLGTKDMAALLDIATKQNARLILGGDTRQHSSVVRGDALRILNTVGGIKTAEVNKIYRQKNLHYRSAVEDLSKGNVKDAFLKLDNIKAIRDVDPMKPNEALVSDYISTVKRGKTALIVSPTHQQGNAVTDEVRSKLRSSGLIGKKEINAKKLTNMNLTEAEKSDWRNFKQGQIIQFNQNVPKIKRGSVWSVKEATEQAITICDQAGEERLLPKDKPAIYDIYKPSQIGLSKGDKVRITRNSFDEDKRRLNNGQSLEVASVYKSGQITLYNPVSKSMFTLNKSFGHLDHDYCTTSHSSQGKTVDEVFISQPASTFTATNAKQFYVSVSRGRDAATIYTDDKIALLDYASEIGDRQSALELVKDKHIDHIEKLARDKPAPQKYANKTRDINRFDNLENDRNYEPGF
jgi:conjugative relaxase-like TrwC/TraI family protein